MDIVSENDDFLKFLADFDANYKKLTAVNRKEFLQHFLKQSCDSFDLAFINQEMDELKTDFIRLLPIETIEHVLKYVEPKEILECCKVSIFEKNLIFTTSVILGKF